MEEQVYRQVGAGSDSRARICVMMKTHVTLFLLLTVGPLAVHSAQSAGRKHKKSPIAQQPIAQQPIAQQIEKALKQSGLPHSHIGVVVAGPTQNLYQLNEGQLFIPASLIKIITAGALLELLSPSLTFTTQFLAHAPIKKGILKGHLYLKGGGDSGFVSESLWNLVNNLTRHQIKEVQGDLIVDASRFDPKTRGPRLSTPSHLSYDAPVSALSFNWNTVNIYLRPSRKVGQPLQLNIDPSPLYFHSVENKTRTVHSKAKSHLQVKRHKTKGLRESLIIKGQMPINQTGFEKGAAFEIFPSYKVHKKRESLNKTSIKVPEKLIYKNILDPAVWTGWNAIAFLKQRGIKVQGQVRKGQTPSQAKILAQWQSRPLADQIKLMMKYSNNFMVEMLLKNMAVELNHKITHQQKGQPLKFSHRASIKRKKSHFTEGVQIIKKYLQKRGIPEKEYTLVQPSGLSRQNKIKPKHLMQFLKYWQGQPLQAEFESAFPLANEDGTLKKYFIPKGHDFSATCKSKHLSPLNSKSGKFKCDQYNQTNINSSCLSFPVSNLCYRKEKPQKRHSAQNPLGLKGRVRAKTASMNGVMGLAGWLTTKDREKIAFVFIFNGPVAEQAKAKALFQTWLVTLFHQGISQI